MSRLSTRKLPLVLLVVGVGTLAGCQTVGNRFGFGRSRTCTNCGNGAYYEGGQQPLMQPQPEQPGGGPALQQSPPGTLIPPQPSAQGTPTIPNAPPSSAYRYEQPTLMQRVKSRLSTWNPFRLTQRSMNGPVMQQQPYPESQLPVTAVPVQQYRTAQPPAPAKRDTQPARIDHHSAGRMERWPHSVSVAARQNPPVNNPAVARGAQTPQTWKFSPARYLPQTGRYSMVSQATPRRLPAQSTYRSTPIARPYAAPSAPGTYQSYRGNAGGYSGMPYTPMRPPVANPGVQNFEE